MSTRLRGQETISMKRVVKKSRKAPERETLTEAYEVRAFRDESEEPRSIEAVVS